MQLLDWVGADEWGLTGVDSIATDPVDPDRVYVLAGTYTNSSDPNNGAILRSKDRGHTWERTPLPFKSGGNMPGRNQGERLVIDPNDHRTLFLGTRSGNGLWKSTDYAQSWKRVTSFPAVGSYAPDPSDPSGYSSDLISVDIDFSKPLVEKLLQGQLDMLVAGVLDSHGAEALSFEPLANERHAVIARRHHPLAGKPGLRLEDLVSQPWILPAPGSLVRDELVSVFLQRGLPLPNNVVQTSSLPVITSLLLTTDMIAPLPEECVQPYCESGELTVLVEDLGLQIGSFGIIVRREHKLSPGAQIMLTALRETAARLYSNGHSQI
jgi:hypothetical protein